MAALELLTPRQIEAEVEDIVREMALPPRFKYITVRKTGTPVPTIQHRVWFKASTTMTDWNDEAFADCNRGEAEDLERQTIAAMKCLDCEGFEATTKVGKRYHFDSEGAVVAAERLFVEMVQHRLTGGGFDHYWADPNCLAGTEDLREFLTPSAHVASEREGRADGFWAAVETADAENPLLHLEVVLPLALDALGSGVTHGCEATVSIKILKFTMRGESNDYGGRTGSSSSSSSSSSSAPDDVQCIECGKFEDCNKAFECAKKADRWLDLGYKEGEPEFRKIGLCPQCDKVVGRKPAAMHGLPMSRSNDEEDEDEEEEDDDDDDEEDEDDDDDDDDANEGGGEGAEDGDNDDGDGDGDNDEEIDPDSFEGKVVMLCAARIEENGRTGRVETDDEVFEAVSATPEFLALLAGTMPNQQLAANHSEAHAVALSRANARD